MKTRRLTTMVAAAAMLSTGLAACGGSSDSGGGGGGTTTKAEYNAGVSAVVNPSDVKGGTLRMAQSADWDSLDPADTYYAYSWNFIRLYGRSLTMFKPGPGSEGTTLTPDLAQTLGVPSDGAKTWTYKLRPGVK